MILACRDRVVLGSTFWQSGFPSFVPKHFFLLRVGLGLEMEWAEASRTFWPHIYISKESYFQCFFMEKQKLILWVPVSSTGKVSDYWIRNLDSILIYTKNWLVSLYLKKQKLIFNIYIYIFSETMYGIYFWEAYLMPIYSLSILTKQKHVPSLSSKIVTSKHLSWF